MLWSRAWEAPMKEPNARQWQVLRMLRECPQPSYREMASRLGISRNGALEHTKALEKKGYVRRTGGSRCVDVQLGALLPDEMVTESGVRLRRVGT